MDPEKPRHVQKLNKAIYGLKQAPRAWFDKFISFLIDFGLCCSKSDPSLFVYKTEKDIIILLLYVDDMVITGNSSECLACLLQQLQHKEFRMTDMGELHYFLGIQVQKHKNDIFLYQQKYAEDLLVVAGMTDCEPMPTPLPQRLNRVEDKSELFSHPTYFRSLAGKLQYLTLTRLDLQFDVTTSARRCILRRTQTSTCSSESSDMLKVLSQWEYLYTRIRTSLSLHTVIVTGQDAALQEDLRVVTVQF